MAKAFPLDKKRCTTAFVDMEAKHGTGGVLYVHDESYTYLMPNDERLPEKFRLQLSMALDSDQGRSMFVVHELDRNLDVYTFDKLTLATELA